MQIPLIPRSYEDIARDLKAKSPEVVPWWLYDTQTYTDNVSTELTFFAATQAARDLSNMDQGGALPHPNVLYIYNIFLDYMSNAAGLPYVTTTAGGIASAINDIGLLHLTGRSRLTLTISDKQYGPWPAAAFPALGAVQGFGWGTFTAEESLAYGHNSLAPRGYIGGAVVIPPKVGFRLSLNWPAAVDLTADYRVRCTLYGAYYRKVA